MLLYSVVLFALAAVFGLYLISRIMGGKLPGWTPVIFHGLFAAAGLVLLLYTAFLSGEAASQPIVIASGLLVAAALGGFFLVTFNLRKKVPPKAVASIHALLAVAGFGTLAAATFGLI